MVTACRLYVCIIDPNECIVRTLDLCARFARLRWYSIENDSFQLDAGPLWTLRVSTAATGDIADSLNDPTVPANNKAFMSGSQRCVTHYGSWWYYVDGYCCQCRMFGQPGDGFIWNGQYLQAARLMVKLTG